jgi:hypothetical protein
MSASHALIARKLPVETIEINSKESFELFVRGLMKDFYFAIASAKFGTEENENFYAAINTLNTFFEFKVQRVPVVSREVVASVKGSQTILASDKGDCYAYIGRLVTLKAVRDKAATDDEIVQQSKEHLGCIPITSSLDEKLRYVAKITIGALVMSMAASDDRYGRQACFDYQLLYPDKKLVEIEAIAGVKRFEHTRLESIRRFGEKILSGEIDICESLTRSEMFPQGGLQMFLSKYIKKALPPGLSEKKQTPTEPPTSSLDDERDEAPLLRRNR